MKLLITSVIPIELFTLARRRKCIEKLRADGVIGARDESPRSKFIKELGGPDCEAYAITASSPDREVLLVAQESSACIVIDQAHSDFILSEESIRTELAERNLWHTEIIKEQATDKAPPILRQLRGALDGKHFGSPKVNYVFSFYTIAREPHGEEVDEDLLKLLAEPSLLDLDDMLSTEAASGSCGDAKVKDGFLEELTDCDIAHSSKTYVTWATSVSLCSAADAPRTRGLITALECKLQIVWNKCHSISALIDGVFQEKNSLTDVSDLYWSFARTLDDARAVISSTFSTRANRLFAEMVKTSRVDGEITRLAQKLELLEKYVMQRNQRQNRIYQKSIEFLLFVTALAALMQVLFPLPLHGVSMPLGITIVSFFAILGTFAIFKAK